MRYVSAGIAGAALLLGGCGSAGTAGGVGAGTAVPGPSAASSASTGPSAAADVTAPTADEAAAAVGTAPARWAVQGTADGAAGAPVAAQDEVAGVLERTVPDDGTGRTVAVPGAVSAPREGRVMRVRVEVEEGLPVDGQAFAAMVHDTLNDPRSWAADGLAFPRTDGEAEVVVVLASPQTSAEMCRPLQTNGTLSCRRGEKAIITHHRWVNGMEDYGDDLTGYRRYVVNHEVGHVLGHGHVACPGEGQLAPVMQQQTIQVRPCLPNAWPYP